MTKFLRITTTITTELENKGEAGPSIPDDAAFPYCLHSGPVYSYKEAFTVSSFCQEFSKLVAAVDKRRDDATYTAARNLSG
jgi:hypothetical protein